MPYNRKSFGIIISRLRIQKGFSQETLPGLAGISRSHLTAIENGYKTVRLDTLWRLAEALQVAPHKLILMVEQLESAKRSEC